MRTLLVSILLFLPACGSADFDVADPSEGPGSDAEGDSCVLDIVRNVCVDAVYLDSGVDTGRHPVDYSDTPDGDSPFDSGYDSGIDSGIDSGHDSAIDSWIDTGPRDTAPAPDTAKPDTHCPNPDDWTNCGICCYPAICVGGSGGTCG